MLIKTSELIGDALNWTVAKCVGVSDEMLSEFFEGEWWYSGSRCYQTDWAQGGPIIERENIGAGPGGVARKWNSLTEQFDQYTGPTPLVAAMRCLVASRLGDEVEIPDELA